VRLRAFTGVKSAWAPPSSRVSVPCRPGLYLFLYRPPRTCLPRAPSVSHRMRAASFFHDTSRHPLAVSLHRYRCLSCSLVFVPILAPLQRFFILMSCYFFIVPSMSGICPPRPSPRYHTIPVPVTVENLYGLRDVHLVPFTSSRQAFACSTSTLSVYLASTARAPLFRIVFHTRLDNPGARLSAPGLSSRQPGPHLLA